MSAAVKGGYDQSRGLCRRRDDQSYNILNEIMKKSLESIADCA